MLRLVLVLTVAAACGSRAPSASKPPDAVENSRASLATASVYVKVLHGVFTPLRCVQDGVVLDECAVPTTGAELRDEHGTRWRVTGTKEDACGFGLVEVTATPIGKVREADHDGAQLTVFPPDADLRVHPGFDASVEEDADARAAIARVVEHAAGPQEVSLDQTLEADFDGDGVPDRLYVASGEHEVDDEDEAWVAIVYFPHDDPAAAIQVIATNRDDDSYSIGGTFDLEGDGSLELYYIFQDDEDDAVGVVGFIGGVPTVVTQTWVC